MKEIPGQDQMTISEIPMTEMVGRGSSMTGMMTETDTETMTGVMRGTGIESMTDSPEIEENMIEGTVGNMIGENGM